MSLTATDLQTVVAPPALVPYRFGLFSQVSFEAVGRELFGLTWESNGCRALAETTDPCVDPEVAAKTPNESCVVMTAEGFTVYYYDTSSVAGYTVDEHTARAQERFLNGEQHAVEVAFQRLMNEWIVANAYTPLDVTSDYVLAPNSLLPYDSQAVLALAAVEQALANAVYGQGVIHMTRFMASVLGDYLTVQGAGLFTRLGTPVIAGGGYSTVAPDDNLGIIGTGPLIGSRGPLETATAVDRSINSVSILVERTYTIGWDCSLVAATLSTISEGG